MIEVKTIKGKTEGKIEGLTTEVLFDLTSIVQSVVRSISKDDIKQQIEFIRTIYKAAETAAIMQGTVDMAKKRRETEGADNEQ